MATKLACPKVSAGVSPQGLPWTPASPQSSIMGACSRRVCGDVPQGELLGTRVSDRAPLGNSGNQRLATEFRQGTLENLRVCNRAPLGNSGIQGCATELRHGTLESKDKRQNSARGALESKGMRQSSVRKLWKSRVCDRVPPGKSGIQGCATELR